MAYIEGLEKVKVNNAIVTFLVITQVLIAPFSALLIFKPDILFSPYIIQYAIAALCFGCMQFSLIYCTSLIAYAISIIGKQIFLNDFFRLPLILSIITSTIIYFFLIDTVNSVNVSFKYLFTIFLNASHRTFWYGVLIPILLQILFAMLPKRIREKLNHSAFELHRDKN
ncbi:hypothetical protein [Mucilaginibacter sp. KACC 22063]|uniref:hypothetical protein n=1 Tax=Mucilaginibacter sp. KACC 22063 TaxID=3025666 RepID=UPI0023657AD1|nr:hypothetical protein [Mucilaginibacter sp. KACC 22063]WDF57115.1 hypothetical protein PQ461_08620 [Mucilaginibacter sp. KACC 22063]